LRLLDNATIRLDAENEVQPDAALCVAEGGQTQVVGNFLHGAPELVVEVAISSASYDLHEKFRVYRRTA
jgi:Uma2 family endonuclease